MFVVNEVVTIYLQPDFLLMQVEMQFTQLQKVENLYQIMCFWKNVYSLLTQASQIHCFDYDRRGGLLRSELFTAAQLYFHNS